MSEERDVSEDFYDVVIVGGGIAGATVAKTIADRGGARILILEAGSATGMSAGKYQSHVTEYQEALEKVPNSPYPANRDAPQPDVLDIRQILEQPAPDRSAKQVVDDVGYFVQTGPLPFSSDFTRALGGTTLHWLGTCLRMLPNDFRLQTEYGRGVDWPIGYEDLKGYYERAERDIIGVAGDVADQIYPGIDERYFGDYEYPMERVPLSYVDQVLSERLDGQKIRVGGREYEVALSGTPAGRNSTPRGDYQPVGAPGNPQQGQRCEGNSSCIPICPVQAKYSALKTLYDLLRQHPATSDPSPTRSSVRVQSQAVASKVELDEHGRVSGIAYEVYGEEAQSPSDKRVARGRTYVLAANAIQNATLLLASGVANSSGMVGRNLMDHPLILTWGLIDVPVWSYRGPGSTSGIPAFRDGPFRDRHSAFRIEVGNWGWSFATGAPYSTVNEMVQGSEQLFGTRLRSKVGEVIPRQFRMALEMEQIPEPSNYTTIDSAYRDALGNFRPVIRYDLPDYVRAGMAAAKEASDRMYALLGVPPLGPDEDPADFPYPRDYTHYAPADPGYVTYMGEGYSFEGAGHIAGTHRMGNSPRNSVVDPRQRAWDHDNLYLVGCGNMPTVGTSNPTLTMTALAVWAGDNIAEDLRSRR